MASPGPRIERVTGAAVEPYLADVARLRIATFRDYPYLYDGSLAYESDYLRVYVEAPASLVMLALVGETVVGASTAIPLVNEDAAFIAPFTAAGMDPHAICYGGESLLLPAYRGTGVYRQFFLGRESFAREHGLTTFAFCSVQRADDHPLRPSDYEPLDPVWRRYGYEPRPDLIARIAWKDIDEPAPTEKPMMFWLKPLALGPTGR